MLLAVIALGLGLGAALLTGRRTGGAGSPAEPGWRVLPVAAVGAALLASGSHLWSGPAAAVSVAAGYLGLAAWAAVNRSHPGAALFGVGVLANLVVSLVNGGMPVSGAAPGVGLAGFHHGLSTADHLTGLADTIRIRPLGETVSPGDLLIAAGAALGAYAAAGAYRAPRRPGAARSSALPAGRGRPR